MNRFLKITLPAVAALIALADSASACSVCTGTADSPVAPAMNASILVLLGVIMAVGSIFGYFLVFLAKRDGLPLTDTPEISGGMTSPSPQQS